MRNTSFSSITSAEIDCDKDMKNRSMKPCDSKTQMRAEHLEKMMLLWPSNWIQRFFFIQFKQFSPAWVASRHTSLSLSQCSKSWDLLYIRRDRLTSTILHKLFSHSHFSEELMIFRWSFYAWDNFQLEINLVFLSTFVFLYSHFISFFYLCQWRDFNSHSVLSFLLFRIGLNIVLSSSDTQIIRLSEIKRR